MGCQQAWINVELVCSIKYGLQMMQTGDAKYPMRFVRFGRTAVFLFTLIFASLVLAITVFEQFKLDEDERVKFISSGLKYYVPSIQMTAFCLLTSSIVVVRHYLVKQESMA